MGDGLHENGNNLAATREDMAELRGAVLTELKNLASSISRVESSTKHIAGQYENLEDRVEALEEHNRFEAKIDKQHDDKSEQERLRRSDMRGWISMALAGMLALYDVITHVGSHKP